MSSVCSEEGQVLKRIPGKEDGNDNSGGAEGGEGKMLSEGEGLFSVVPESPIEGKSVERGSPTIRTPKRRKFNLRDFELVHQMSHLYSGNCCMYLVQMRGPIELIYCNQGLNEAFLNPFMSMYFHSGGSSFEEVGSRNTKNQVIELRKKTKIIAAVPRRINLQTNEPEMKPGSKNDTRRYKKCYFVSYTKDESERSDNDRQEGLWAICNILNDYNEKNAAQRGLSVNSARYFVPKDWDQTPEKKERWDERICDEDIVLLLQQILQQPLSRHFASSVGKFADDLFTPPYCPVAREHLGYGEGLFLGSDDRMAVLRKK